MIESSSSIEVLSKSDLGKNEVLLFPGTRSCTKYTCATMKIRATMILHNIGFSKRKEKVFHRLIYLYKHQTTMSKRPQRNRKAPRPVYVPDEDIQFTDDLSVDSDFDMDGNESIGSEDSFSSEESGDDEYDMNDGFLVPDDYVDSSDDLSDDSEEEFSDYSDSSSAGSVVAEEDDDDDPVSDSDDQEEKTHDPSTLIQPSSEEKRN